MEQKITLNGIAVEDNHITILQGYAKEYNIPFLAVTKPSLVGRIKLFIEQNPDKNVFTVPEKPSDQKKEVKSKPEKPKTEVNQAETSSPITEEGQPKTETQMATKKAKKKKAVKKSAHKKAAKKSATKKTAKKLPVKKTKPASKEKAKKKVFSDDDVKELKKRKGVSEVLKEEGKKKDKALKLHKLGLTIKEIAILITDNCNQGSVWLMVNGRKKK